MTERFRCEMEVETMDQVSDSATVGRSIKGVLGEHLPNLRVARLAVRAARKLGGKG